MVASFSAAVEDADVVSPSAAAVVDSVVDSVVVVVVVVGVVVTREPDSSTFI